MVAINVGGAPEPIPNIFEEIDTNQDAKLTLEEVTTWFTVVKNAKVPPSLWESEDKDAVKIIIHFYIIIIIFFMIIYCNMIIPEDL